MQLSIIIPSLNSPIIDLVIDRILNQESAELVQEIIVVGRDDDGLIQVSERVKFIETEQRVTAAQARNLGISSSSADIYIFLDSDCLPQPHWLKEHLAAHAVGHSVVGGGVLPEGCNYWHLTYNLTLFHEYLSVAESAPRKYLPGLNMSVERPVIDAIGVMDETIHRVEDIDWTTRMRRAGYQPYLWSAASISHRHNRTDLKSVWRDCASSGSRMRLIRLKYNQLLEAPAILRYPRLILLLSPLIAAYITLRIVTRQPGLFARYWYTVPGIYLTKIAWCWGASRGKEYYDLS